MKTYKMTIAGIERELTICPVNDSLSIGAFVILGDAQLSEAAARDLLKLAPEYDYIITAEAKGITLAHEMARQHGDRTYFVARKTPKLYMSGVFQVDVRSITTAKDQMLYLDTAEAFKGKNVEFHVCGFCEPEYDGRLQEEHKKGIVNYHGKIALPML